MAKDYISREAALKAIQPKHAPAINSALAAMINSVPAADVLEVRHGRWHRFMKGSGQSGNTLICSNAFQCTVCKESFWNKSNYCPNCGAKMEEE